MIVLKEEDIKQLENMLSELPFKYANPLFQFFSQKIVQPEEQEQEIKEEKDKKTKE